MKSKSLKAGIWYTISNFLVKGITFLLLPIFTRIMTSADVGYFSNVMAWFNILAIITTFEVYSSVSIARFDYKDDLDTYVSSSLFLGTLITLFFYIISLVFHNFFENLFSFDFLTLNIVYIYLLIYPAIQMFQIRNQIIYNHKPIVIVSILNAIVTSIVSIICTLTFASALTGRIVGYFGSSIIICVFLYFYLIKKGKRISPKYWKYCLKISFPLIWHLLAGYLLSSMDRIMIVKLVGAEANALYSVAYTISMAVSILWSSMNNAWSPWAYEQMDKKDYNALKKNSKPYTIFFLIIVTAFMLVTPELLLIMGGKNYIEAKYVMPPVMIGFIFQFLYSFYVNIEFYHKKQKNIAMGTIIACIVNGVLNYLLIPKFGYIAAAYTTLIGYIVLFIIHFCLVKKMNCTSWYDTKFVFKIILYAFFMLGVVNLLYINNYIRYGIILLVSIFVIYLVKKNYKSIIKYINKKQFFKSKKIIN